MGKYEEALARARQGRPIDEVFPELKESEDERVRSFLYEFIKVCGWSEKQYPPREKCLAYLEKQKEQKPEWKPLEESMEALLLAIEGKWDAIKPTGYMSRRLEDLYDGLVNTFNIRETYISKTNYTEKDIEELKTLKSKIDVSMEQKPSEWSEEDENYYDTIVRKLQVLGNDSGLTTNQIDFLDKHRPQPHWKPSEEQMEALAWYSGNSGVPPTGDKAIKSLYDDLRKLM